jgi:predicted esterase
MTSRVAGKGVCLIIKTFGRETAGATPTLVVMLHGDASGGGSADYHYPLVEGLVRPGVVGVAMIRPGYPDSSGAASQGETRGRNDHYTPENIDIVADAIAALKARHKAKEVALIGHSGGAAMVGVIMGRHVGLAERALLIACPCDVGKWRAEGGRRPWLYSLSPHSFVNKVPATAKIIAATGTADDNTRARLAEDYVASLVKRGVAAKFVSLPGSGHNIGKTMRELAEFKAVLEAIVTGAMP